MEWRRGKWELLQLESPQPAAFGCSTVAVAVGGGCNSSCMYEFGSSRNSSSSSMEQTVLVSVWIVDSSIPRRCFLLFLASFPHPWIVSLILCGRSAALQFDPIQTLVKRVCSSKWNVSNHWSCRLYELPSKVFFLAYRKNKILVMTFSDTCVTSAYNGNVLQLQRN